MRSTVRNVLTIDVEEYFQVENFRGLVPESSWPARAGRAARATHAILDLLDDCGAKATFFVLGWIADRDPGLVRAIAERGHEVGSHGYAHRPIYVMSRAEFRSDVRRARRALESAAGACVTGYRAPTFSVVDRTLWALDILLEEGHEFDSSIFPVHHDRYGIPSAPRFLHARRTPLGRTIAELPPMTARVAGVNIPLGGGAYFRLLPVSLFIHTVRRLNAAGRFGTLYLHPWEFDPGQPRLRGRCSSRFRHYHNLHQTQSKLRRLLRTAVFGTASEAVAAWRAKGSPS